MTRDDRHLVPWPRPTRQDYPLADVDGDRFMVFVPAIMSVGVVFSIVTLLRDALQRTGRTSRERRIAIQTASTVDELLGGAASDGHRFALLARRAYLALALAIGVTAMGIAALAISVYASGDGDASRVGWVLAFGLVVAALALVVATACASAFRSWPHPRRWVLPTLRILPLTRNPARVDGGPSWRLSTALVASVVSTTALSFVVAARRDWVEGRDETISTWFVDASWIERLKAIDLLGSTVISISFVVLIGLSAFRCRVMAFVYPVAFVFAWTTTELLQELIERPRPIGFGEIESFPSGHMTQAVFLAGLLPTAIGVLLRSPARIVRELRALMFLFVVFTGFIRLYQQDHWPSDAIAGLLLGLVVVFGATWALEHRGWHKRCSSCSWSAHPEADSWGRGVFDLSPKLNRRLVGFGAVGALVAASVLFVSTSAVGLPTDPEGDGLGSAIAQPAQLGLAGLMAVAGLLAFRWRAFAAFLMAFCATGLGLLASIEYSPVLAFSLTAMLLVPAVVTWVAWQPHATVGSIAALALVTVTSLTATTLGSREIYGHYFGPSHPSSVAAPLDSEADWLWLGGVTVTEATVVAGGLPAGESAELTYWTDAVDPAHAVVTSDEDGIARFALGDLEPATEYVYVIGSDADRSDGSFRTFAQGPQSLEVLVASCARNESNGGVFDTMVDHDPDLYLALGDLHYANLESTDPDDHLRQYGRSLSQPGQAALFSSVPTAYVWDDHDFGPNDGDSSSVTRDAVSMAYRQAVPVYDVDPDPESAINQAFTVGRVRFIVADTRSMRTADTMLGEEQLTWLIDELITSSQTHGLVVWANPTPWISSFGPGADDWSAFPGERRFIADAIAEAGITNLLMVSGDAHMVAIDDGANSGYATDGSRGFPVFHAAALDRPGSVKGGPYSHGTFPGPGQYGVLDIADDGGSTIGVALIGRDWQGNELVRYEYDVEVSPAA